MIPLARAVLYATLILALSMPLMPTAIAASGLSDVLRVQDYTLGLDVPAVRVCVSDDGGCDRLGFSVENQEQLTVVNDTPFRNAAGNVINYSTQPHDHRAIACWNALATGDAGMQACAYGSNYAGALGGMPLAGKAKVVGYQGLVLGTYGGRMEVVANSTHVATFDSQGFGFGGLALSGRNTFALGWGQLPNTVSDGEIVFAAIRTSGVMHLWYKLSTGEIGCLTCPK